MKDALNDGLADHDDAGRFARIALILCFAIPGFAILYFGALYLIGSQ